jgi:transcriptional regulator with XRE-family HTH domain
MSTPRPWRTLGACMAAARRRAALTQQEVARQIGISQSAYSQMERGLIRPRPVHLYRLAVVLSINLDRLAASAQYPLDQLVLALGRTG